jgi:thioesterase domain-containing protein/acyl carrier protein
MLPSAFVVLEKLPLTRTGKVARSALPAPQPVRRDSATPENAPRNQVEQQVARIWEDILQIEGIGLTDDFFQIGGHSLLAVRVIAEINGAFGVDLPLVTIFRAPTVESLAVAVLSSHELQLKPPGLIAPRQGETGQPIFWAPSVGTVERYVECHNLARLLRGTYRFYGFDPAPELIDIDSLAQHCVELIRAEQPHGPYFVAGYCQCGHVAYEIATRLERDGDEVALLAIIDASARDFGASVRQRLYWIRDGFRGNPRVVFKRVRSVVRNKLTRTNGINGLVANNGQPMNRFMAHGQAVKRHKVCRFSGTIELIRSQEWLARLPHAPLLGWDALAATVRVHPVGCNHSAVLKDPTSVQRIVDTLKEALLCQPA